MIDSVLSKQRAAEKLLQSSGLVPEGYAVRVQFTSSVETAQPVAEEIIDIVCSTFGVRRELLKSRSRKRELVFARAVASTLICFYVPGFKLSDIDYIVRGKRDHAQVIFYRDELFDIICDDPRYGRLTNQVSSIIQARLQ